MGCTIVLSLELARIACEEFPLNPFHYFFANRNNHTFTYTTYTKRFTSLIVR